MDIFGLDRYYAVHPCEDHHNTTQQHSQVDIFSYPFFWGGGAHPRNLPPPCLATGKREGGEEVTSHGGGHPISYFHLAPTGGGGKGTPTAGVRPTHP